MTGRAGAQELAYYGIGLAPQLDMQTIGIGLLVGTVVLAAQADGAGEAERCGRIWRLAMILALRLGLFYAVALLWRVGILLLIGQTPADRHSVVQGTSLPVRVNPAGHSTIKQTKH